MLLVSKPSKNQPGKGMLMLYVWILVIIGCVLAAWLIMKAINRYWPQ